MYRCISSSPPAQQPRTAWTAPSPGFPPTPNFTPSNHNSDHHLDTYIADDEMNIERAPLSRKSWAVAAAHSVNGDLWRSRALTMPVRDDRGLDGGDVAVESDDVEDEDRGCLDVEPAGIIPAGLGLFNFTYYYKLKFKSSDVAVDWLGLLFV